MLKRPRMARIEARVTPSSSPSSVVADLLGSLTPRSLDECLPKLLDQYADDMVFRDPIQTLNGKAAFEQMNRHLAARAKDFRFDVLDQVTSPRVTFLRWCMHFTPTFGRPMNVEGVSYLRMNEHDRVVEHVDYWDLPSFFATAIPGGERVLRAVLRPLA